MKNAVAVCVGAVLFANYLWIRHSSGAENFQDPANWAVGDSGSTFQEWNAEVADYLATDAPPTASGVNPALSEDATLSVQLPGFVAGSGGYYSFTGPYSVEAEVFNHGGSSGSEAYPAAFGTRVLVQTAATLNSDLELGGPASVFQDSVEIVQLDGAPIAGGNNDSLLQATELYQGEVITSYGPATQQELLFEFWLPGYTGDLRVDFDVIAHSSFRHLRIDSRIVNPADFDGDGDVDGADLVQWIQHFGVDDGADADSDMDCDLADLLAWQRGFTGPTGEAAVGAVPEPASLALMILCVLPLTGVSIHRINRS